MKNSPRELTNAEGYVMDFSLRSTGLNHYMFHLAVFPGFMSIYISLLSSLKA